MNLIELKHYMQSDKVATLSSLCHQFKLEAETLRCMLMHWMQKGKIRPCVKKAACGSKCFKCPIASQEMYEWVETCL
jgi:hypothetical protein